MYNTKKTLLLALTISLVRLSAVPINTSELHNAKVNDTFQGFICTRESKAKELAGHRHSYVALYKSPLDPNKFVIIQKRVYAATESPDQFDSDQTPIFVRPMQVSKAYIISCYVMGPLKPFTAGQSSIEIWFQCLENFIAQLKASPIMLNIFKLKDAKPEDLKRELLAAFIGALPEYRDVYQFYALTNYANRLDAFITENPELNPAKRFCLEYFRKRRYQPDAQPCDIIEEIVDLSKLAELESAYDLVNLDNPVAAKFYKKKTNPLGVKLYKAKSDAVDLPKYIIFNDSNHLSRLDYFSGTFLLYDTVGKIFF